MTRKEESAPFLRLIYALVFLGLAAAVIGGAVGELLHLWFALTHPYHFGSPPRPLALLAVLFAVVGALGILFVFARGKQPPLQLSAFVLVAVLAAFFGLRGDAPEGRTWASADKDILLTGSALQKKMVDVIQTRGKVPMDAQAWQRELDALAKEPSPARTRSFQRLPYLIERVAEPDALPSPLVPGRILLWVSEDGFAFELRPVGFSPDGQVAVLADDRGEPLVLKGTFNPDLAGARRAPALPQ